MSLMKILEQPSAHDKLFTFNLFVKVAAIKYQESGFLLLNCRKFFAIRVFLKSVFRDLFSKTRIL